MDLNLLPKKTRTCKRDHASLYYENLPSQVLKIPPANVTALQKTKNVKNYKTKFFLVANTRMISRKTKMCLVNITFL